jgi:CheY-like chemotaxis protein
VPDNLLPTRCFIVDDDEDDQEILAIAIAGSILSDHTCSFAVDGEAAIETLNSDLLPDYIFLDLNMPRMNGIQCLIEIRHIEKLQHIPVVIFTTSTDDSTRTEALRHGATAFITKPTRVSELVSELNNFFTAHKEPQAV